MRKFYDLSHAERAALTDAEMNEYIAHELMSAGVLRPMPYTEEECIEVDIPTTTMFCINLNNDDGYGGDIPDALYRTSKEASAAAVALVKDAKFMCSDWVEGRSFKICGGAIDYSINTVQIADQNDVNKIKPSLQRNAEIEKRNKAKAREYKDANTASNEIINPMRESREASICIVNYFVNIEKTYAEYVKLAGDEEIALKFLNEAYDEADVDNWQEWRKENGE